ncbi:MAG: DUF1385 domain-containing protein [Clostridia bacterium]|nr:DUF1385 domain-containing protein [Clostridia bacterium]
MSDKTEKSCRLGAVGGQAVLEGVMMKHGDRYSVAVRKEDGEIAVSDNEYVSVRKKHKLLNLPIIRGAVNMVEMLALSIKTLNLSAQLSGIEEEVEESRFEKWLREHFGKGILDLVMVLATALGVALSLFLFLFLPSAATKALENAIGWITWSNFELGFWKNIIEGAFKIVIFIGYLSLTLLMKDIRRTFEYHGAEHKSIFCYEAGEELTPENVKKYKRFHPRCGTSFMFVIIILGVVISSLPIFSWDNIFLRFATRLLFLPITVGLGYEFIRFAGKHDNVFTRILSAPGLWIQRITTREPDLEQIEVAIVALKRSMPEEFPDEAEAPDVQETEYTPADEVCEQAESAEQQNAAASADGVCEQDEGADGELSDNDTN